MKRNRIMYSAVFLFSCINLWISENKGSYTLLYAVVILAAISLFMALFGMRSLSLIQLLDDFSVIKGDKTRYRLKIESKYTIFCGIKVIFKSPGRGISFNIDDISMDMLNKGQYTYEAEIISKYRSICRIGVGRVEFYDMLGIFSLKKVITEEMILTVCPRVLTLSGEMYQSIPSEKSGFNYRFKPEDYSEVTDIRKYISSDTMKRIHWKLSAKKNELLVKNYSVSHSSAAALIVDNREVKVREDKVIVCEDRIVEAAVSLACHFLGFNRPLILDYLGPLGKESLNGNTIHEFDGIYAACSAMEFQGSSLAPVFPSYYGSGSSVTDIYVVSCCMDGELVGFTADAALMGYDVSFIHFYDRPADDLSQRFANSGVKYFGYSLERGMEENAPGRFAENR